MQTCSWVISESDVRVMRAQRQRADMHGVIQAAIVKACFRIMFTMIARFPNAFPSLSPLPTLSLKKCPKHFSPTILPSILQRYQQL